MSDHPHRQPDDQSDESRQTDSEFPFEELSKSEPSRPPSGAESVAKALVGESTVEDDFYRGGGGTTVVETPQSTHPLSNRGLAISLNRRLSMLLGLAILSAVVAAIVVGLSTWTSLQGTKSAFTSAVIGGGGLFTASILALYLGWILGRTSIVQTVLFGD